MVETQFQSLLKLFEPYFQCPLKEDSHQSCLIRLQIGLEVQMEFNRYGALLLGCSVGKPIGQYQHLLFKAALKSNHENFLAAGGFGFSKKTGEIILFKLIEPSTIQLERVPLVLDPFIKQATIWRNAILEHQVPHNELSPSAFPASSKKFLPL